MSKQLAEAWFAAFQNKSISQLEALLAEAFSHSSPFGTIEPREAYLDLVRANPDAFFSPKIDVQDMIVDGERVAVRYLVNGNPACDCIYVRKGRIESIYSYYHYGEKPSF